MRRYPESLEDLKTDRLEIIKEIKISLEEKGAKITEEAILKAQKQLVKVVTTDTFTHLELDIWEAIEKAVSISTRPDVVDLHAINLAYAKQNLPSSMR